MVTFCGRSSRTMPVVRHLVGLGVEEVGGPVDQHQLVAVARRAARRIDADVAGLAAEHLRRLIEGLAALQRLDHEGIAGRRQRAGAPVAREDQGVVVQPVGGLLAARQREAAGDEGLRRQVEFADR